MKRLLEWKQRMLQSPLNRKVSQGSARGRPEYLYRNVDGPCQHKMDPYGESYKSSNALPQYNSYSSDDEGKCLYNVECVNSDLQSQHVKGNNGLHCD